MEPHRSVVQPGNEEQDPVTERAEAAWRRRPFARTFDLIASSYGWTDDQILDLTMARLRQVREVIWERQAEDWRRDLTVREVELRTLASFIAGAAGNRAGVREAAAIRLLPDEPRPVKPIPYESAVRWFGA